MYFLSESLMGLTAFLTLFLVLKSVLRMKRRVQLNHLMGYRIQFKALFSIYPEGWNVLNKLRVSCRRSEQRMAWSRIPLCSVDSRDG